MNCDFWQNKKVLITGHTGFKGAWLTKVLLNCGAKVCGYALKQECDKAIYNEIGVEEKIESCIGDICDEGKLMNFIRQQKPEIVFHLAAQPIVRYSYKNPLETYKTNVIGTTVLLECIKKVNTVKSVVNVTTDKVYENNNLGVPFLETDRLLGYDPYAASKVCSEIVTSSYVSSFFNINEYGKTHNVAIATARAGNVIGGGDYAPDRLIPDCMRAVQKREEVVLRNPNSVRPWQNVLEPIAFYILLAEKLYREGTKYSGAWNIGPKEEDCLSVVEVLEKFQKYIPDLHFKIESSENSKLHEASMLLLNSEKARSELGFEGKWGIEDAIKYTALWYECQLNQGNLLEMTDSIIKEYFK